MPSGSNACWHASAGLVAMAQAILRDAHEAEDIVQQTLAAVLERISEIDPEKLPRYLNRAVRLNALKRKSRRKERVSLDEIAELAAGGSAEQLDPFELDEMLDELPLAQRNVIRMRFYFGMTFRQIGQSLSISTHTAASRCRYALAKLRERLKP